MRNGATPAGAGLSGGMSDVLMLLAVLAFFVLAALFLRGVERL